MKSYELGVPMGSPLFIANPQHNLYVSSRSRSYEHNSDPVCFPIAPSVAHLGPPYNLELYLVVSRCVSVGSLAGADVAFSASSASRGGLDTMGCGASAVAQGHVQRILRVMPSSRHPTDAPMTTSRCRTIQMARQ